MPEAGLNEDFRGDNADRVWAALQIGLPPRRIDILTSVSGVGFEAAWPDLEALGEPLD